MLNRKIFAQLLITLLITVVCLSKCNQGTVQLHSECISCTTLPNTISHSNTINSCQCINGFLWSPQEVACIKLPILRSSNYPKIFQPMDEQIQEEVTSSRLLQIGCDTIRGFINKNNMCINCKDIAWSSGFAKDQSSCYCQPPYIWNAYYKVCGCYIEHTNLLYINGASCNVCNTISSTTTSSQCNACRGGPFGYSLYGCVNCTSIPFGTGAVSSSYYGMCTCQPGYTFNLWLAACICSMYNKYALTTANTCQACSSLSAGSQNACLSCSTSFFSTGYVCKNTSLFGNYNTTSNGCPTNYILTSNPITNQTIRCVCSASIGYYTNNTNCLSCTNNPITGIAPSTCSSCSISAGFFRTAKQCIYCPNAPYSTPTATTSGCLCQANYYWSAITSNCLCDWTKNYYGVPGSCINCLSLPNTVAAFSATGCSCVTGYIWNGNQCICDLSKGTFMLAGQCINCNSVFGAAPIVAAGGKSCICLQGQTWDPTQLKCICDYTQNFWMINGVCHDCTAVAKTSGVATSSGCQCGPGLIWMNSTNKCDCPTGYVNMGSFCRICTNITLPSGATVSGCQICNVTQGFFLSGGICYACASQKYTTGTATLSGCTCTNSSLAWVTAYGSCVCTFASAYTTTIINGSLSCVACPTRSCQCGYPGSGTIYSNNICINCVGIPNSNGIASNGRCLCNTGFAFTVNVYPLQCYCSFKLGYYLSVACKSCTTLPTTGTVTSAGCQICSYSQGFIYLSNDTCIQCSSLIGTNGSATASGCGCTTGSWNSILAQCVNVTCSAAFIYSSANQQCICNLNTAITSGTNCILCSSIISSTGIPSSPTACKCNQGFVWTISSSGPGSCTSMVSSCNITTSVVIGVLCYNCLTTQFSTGPVVGTANCICPSPLVWAFNTSTNTGACICISSLQIPSSTGTSCLCNPAYAIASLTNACIDCRTIPYTTNTTVSGACGCVNNFKWTTSPSPACTCLTPFTITGGQCICNPTTTIPINGSCFLCANSPNATGVSTGTTCVCQIYYMWNGTACISNCNSTSVVITSSTTSTFTCLNCGNIGTFTLARINATTCSCNTGLFWNSRGYCDCGSTSAMIITGTTYVCVICNSAVFSNGQNTSYACSCPTPLTWNPTTKTCNCGSSAIVAYINSVYSCVTCNNLIYASSRLNINTCNCISPSFVWSSSTYQCRCSASNSVIFLSTTGTYSCITCNLTIYALAAVSTSTCSCINSMFSWSPNVGCVCNSSSAIIVGTGSTTTCLNCNSSIYAVAKGNNNTCNCMSPLIWSSSTNQCTCPTSNFVISISSTGLYSCVPCNSIIYAINSISSTACSCISPLNWSSSTSQCTCPIANNVIFISSTGVYSCVACNSSIYAISAITSTVCSCNNALFVWSPNVGCICLSSAAIITGTGTTATCIICNSTIFSSGKSPNSNTCVCLGTLTWQGTTCGCPSPQVVLNSFTCGAASVICPPSLVLLPNNTCIGCNFLNYAFSRFNSTTCNCLSAALVWIPAAGNCQCRIASSIIFIIGGAYTCLICNATIFSTGPATLTTCACMGTGLVWNSSIGTCGCNPISVVNSQGSNYTCIMCNSAVYAINKKNPSTCNCIDTSFTWTGNRCACPAGSIIGFNFKCLQCPTNATLNVLACNCSTVASPFSIWNDLTKTCVACGTSAVPNSIAAFYGVACQCIPGYIWDVMTNACIKNCSGSTCPMTCNLITFSIAGIARVALGITRNIIISASQNIQSYYQAAGSDYSSLNATLACPCQAGTFWNSLTMRCYSQSFNLV